MRPGGFALLGVCIAVLMLCGASAASATVNVTHCGAGETEAETSAEFDGLISSHVAESEGGPCGQTVTAAPEEARESGTCGPKCSGSASASGSVSSTASTALTSEGGTLHTLSQGSGTATAQGTAASISSSTLGSGDAEIQFTVTEKIPFTISANVTLAKHEAFQRGSVTLFGAGAIFTLEGGSSGMSGVLEPGTYSLDTFTTIHANAVATSIEPSATSQSSATAEATLTLGAAGPCPAGQVPTVKVGFAVGEGCFTERKSSEGAPTGIFETEQKAYVGGFEVDPRPAGKLVLDTKTPALKEEGAGAPIVMDGFEIPIGVASLPVGLAEGTFELNQAGTIEKALLGMPVKGKLKASWSEEGKGSSLEGELSISKLIGSFSVYVASPTKGTEVEAKFKLKGVNGVGFSISQAEAKIDELNLIPVAFKVPNTLTIKNALFRYEKREGKPFWRAGAALSIPLKNGGLDVGGEVFMFDGSIAGGGVNVDGIEKPIPDTPLVLQRIEGDIVLKPEFSLSFGVGATFGPKLEGKQIASLDGNLTSGVLVPPSDCPNGVDPFKIDAKFKLNPLDNLSSQISKTEMTARVCGYVGPIKAEEVTVKGSIEFGNIEAGTVIGYEGTQTGFVGETGVDLEGGASISIPLLPRISGRAIISDLGVAACGRINASFEGGFGYRFGQGGIPTTFSGCDLGPFRPTALPATARAAAAGARTISVRRGLRLVAFSAGAAGGPPRVRVRGPHGASFSSPVSGALRSQAAVIVPSAFEKTTYVVITRPAAGRWKIESLAPGVPITRVSVANGLPRPHVSARIIHPHHRLALTYRVAPLRGQRVVFYERGTGGVDRLLGSAHGRRGTLGFAATVSPKRARTIVAEVSQNGLPRAVITVARFTAAIPAAPGKPTLSVKRQGSSLTVSWHKVARASRYLVTVTAGETLLQRLSTTATVDAVTGLPGAGAVNVTVQAFGPLSAGPAASVQVH